MKTNKQKKNIQNIEIQTESIRKLSNFNFQWTKTLYQNILSHIAFFFTLFKAYKGNKLYEITLNKRFLRKPEKINSNFTGIEKTLVKSNEI